MSIPQSMVQVSGAPSPLRAPMAYAASAPGTYSAPVTAAPVSYAAYGAPARAPPTTTTMASGIHVTYAAPIYASTAAASPVTNDMVTYAIPIQPVARKQEPYDPWETCCVGFFTWLRQTPAPKATSVTYGAPPAQDQAAIGLINRLLADTSGFKRQVTVCWDRVARGATDVDLNGLRALAAEMERTMSLPSKVFGNLEITYERFDFDGNGRLSFNEAYRCVRQVVKAYRQQLGGAPQISVPYKTPEQAGLSLIKVLAAGGQGEAQLVHSALRGENIVLKVYDKGNANAGGIEDLQHEMETMQMVEKSDNVAHCFEIFQDQGHYYMTSGANIGGDFASIRKKAGAAGFFMSEEWFKDLFTQSWSGLAYMHSKALMHCDIKEPNMMLRTDDVAHPQVVIIDLGLAQLDADQTGLGTCGTPGYIPPETWQTGVWYPRGDVFAMGVVCFQLLTNSTPDAEAGLPGVFSDGCRDMDDVQRATTDRQPPFEKLAGASAILDWLRPCLEKNRRSRPKAPRVLQLPWFA